MRETLRAKRLHNEAQARYAKRMAEAKIPTLAMVIRAVGIAFATASVDAQIVNTGNGQSFSKAVLNAAIEDLVIAGYTKSAAVQQVRRWLGTLEMDRQAARAAHDDDAGFGPMPGA